MNIVNFSEARNNFKALLDRVANDLDCTVIVRRDAEDAVVMSKSHYDSLIETVYLLKSPANAKHLQEAHREADLFEIAEYRVKLNCLKLI